MAPRTVLCFGDSNTHGTIAMTSQTDRRRHPVDSRWPSVMARDLPDDWDIIAEGHPGRTTVWDDPIEGLHKNGARMLDASLESHRPIDLVVLMLGTNDLKARFGLSAHDIALGVQRLATEIQRSDCGPDATAPEVLIAAPVAVREVGILRHIFVGAADKSRELPDCLKEVVQQAQAGFIDLNTVAEVDPVDGIHLGTDAHAAIGKAVARAVRKQLT